MKRLILLDGNSLLHRAYHALPKTFTDAAGNPTNALFGFSSMLLKIIQELQPDYLAVAFDHPGATFRHAQFVAYKEGRPEMEKDLASQVPRVKEMLWHLRIPFYEIEGYEGEDLLGTIVNQTRARDLQTTIVSGDRDTLQLVGPKVKVLAPQKGITQTVLYDEAKVREEYGLIPEQFADYKALRGDPSDRIPGVFGIGEKTAVKLLHKYGTLEELYRHLGEIEREVGEKLAQAVEQAPLSKQLAVIRRDAPLKFSLQAAAVGESAKEEMSKVFTRLGFKSLVKRLTGGALEAGKRKGGEGRKKLNTPGQIGLL